MKKTTFYIGVCGGWAVCSVLAMSTALAQSSGAGGGSTGTADNNQIPVETAKPDSTRPKPTADAATTTPPASSEESDRVVVTDVSPEELVLPTARPISSVYGEDMSILDTPRSVNIVTKQQLEDRQITSVQDIGQFASGTYSPAEYGLDGIPNIRGVYASLFQNGQEEVFNRNSLVPSFNQMESMDVVKGPGSATYGPPGGGPGGYVNVLTKSPEFDAQHVEIESTIGDYAPGGQSWGHYEWTLDCTGPLIDKVLAYRLSYEGVEGTTYYNNTIDDREDIFAALTYTPNEKVQMDFTAQFFEIRDNDANGFNRPTQNLIDNQQYIYGPQSAPYGPVLGTATTKVYGFEVLNSPYDSNRGNKSTAQLVTKVELCPCLSLVNYNMYQHFDSRHVDGLGYDEYVPGIDLYDTRTELHWDATFTLGKLDLVNHAIGGLSYRYQQGTTFSDYTTEPYNAYDLTKNPKTFLYSTSGYPQIGGVGYGGYPIKDMPGYSAGLYGFDGTNFTDGATGQYEVQDAGVFYQDQTDFGKYVTSLVGLREDYEDGISQIPAGELLDYTGGDQRSGSRVGNYSVFTSLVGHLTKDASVYGTFDRTHGFQGDPNFGGLLAGPGFVTPEELRNQSDLYEAGFKTTLLKQALYLDFDVFDQKRNEYSLGSPLLNVVRARGFESDVAYQPDKHFSVTGNFTYQETNYAHASAFEQTGAPITTGISTPSFTGFPAGNYRLPGTPRILFNAYATYKFDFGLGFGIGPQVQGSQNADLSGDLKIPAQVTWNATIFFRKKNWEAQVNVFNFTDQRNFVSIDPTFAGNDVILEQMPLHVSGTFKVRF
jgi:iron complex outermembrane receptor protein